MNLAAPRIDSDATAPTRGPRFQPRGRNTRMVLAVIALTALLAPAVYLFTQFWTVTGDSAATTATERATVAYARPVAKLLVALVDAQYTAVRGTTVDPSAVRAAVDEVNAVDRQWTDPLRIRPRWVEAAHEIDGALRLATSGPAALRTYAAPIALTQALLRQSADSSTVTRDPGPGSYQLIQVALRSLPDVVVNAGQLTALATAPDAAPASTPSASKRPATTPDPRLTIAADRLARAVTDVSTGLRTGTDPGATYAIGLNLLKPLDEFAAAAEALSQTAVEVPGSGDRDRIDVAGTLLQTKALALETAVLDASDTQLTAQAGVHAERRRSLVLATVIIVLAAGALLWLRVPRPAAGPTGALDDGGSRHRRPDQGGEAGADRPRRVPDLVDTRDLFPPAVGTRGSRDPGSGAAGPR
jgi:hypothetical protein